MNILHLIPSISPLRGGPSQAVLAMVAELRRQGVDARLLTTNDDGPGLLSDLPLGVWHEHQDVPVLAFPRWSPPLRPLLEFAVAPGLTRWLRTHLSEFDLLHVHALFSYPCTSGMAAARALKVPYLLRSIGQLNRWSLEQSPGRKRLLLRLIERRNLEGAAALHFTSDAEQREVADLGLASPSFVLPLGVELPELLPPEDRGENQPTRFLFLSRLHPKKQVPLLLGALAELRLHRPEAAWTLEIAGEGEPAYVAELKALALRLGLAKRCAWLGFVAGPEKQALLQRADWFVLPSASENFGVAAAEALAAGTPVILSTGVAVAEAVRRAGAGLVCAAERRPLKETLLQALEPPSPAQRQAARALAAERFSWPSITERLIEHYRTLAPLSARG
ncbi:glycosyltransferase [Cyanobium sp. Morenito 9A2]|uniref:glycosyltransferase n=1 Tax=Cyanobium sp. Morenito 9A2 TaxID=2823718 RepID=UPI0021BC31F3|nr:glycosyltransferase [Cyanobium sp. Morenito 9A2]MCP9849796.1 glycosyltransferase [Cyanobium sp. Morenito 9A2]